MFSRSQRKSRTPTAQQAVSSDHWITTITQEVIYCFSWRFYWTERYSFQCSL